jgi:ribosomal protein S19E (S16A)
MRQIPEEGIKPIEIKERIYNPRFSDNARRDARGQNSLTWQAMKRHGFIDMKNRKAYVTDEGRRLLEELDRAAKVPADRVRIGGLYNE